MMNLMLYVPLRVICTAVLAVLGSTTVVCTVLYWFKYWLTVLQCTTVICTVLYWLNVLQCSAKSI